MRTCTYTHKGWFGMCPIYLARIDSPSGPDVDERHWLLTPWMNFNEWLVGAWIFVRSMFDPDYEPMFPMLVTGKLESPVTVTYPDME